MGTAITRVMLAGLLLLALPSAQTLAQELPPAAAPAVKPPPRPHRARHHRRRVTLAPASPAPAVPPPQQATAGTTPAPVPNEDIGPPRIPPTSDATVDPGNLSIHYPPLGQGYTPGSSPQDMANTQTPKVPGVTVNVPLQQPVPQTLPPPDSH